MKLSAAQQQMLTALDRSAIAYPIDDPSIGPAKLRTLKALKRRGLVRSRVWDEPRPRQASDEDWIEWAKV
jgi:hypothetical protein